MKCSVTEWVSELQQSIGLSKPVAATTQEFALKLSYVIVSKVLTVWRRNYFFFNFGTPVYKM